MTPTDQALHAAIIDALAPGSRRCTVECLQCKGYGVWKHRRQPDGEYPICTDCDGHGVVFRDDPAGRELIRKAVHAFYPNHPSERWSWDYWTDRSGKSYQSAIEQHVRDYEKPADNLRTGDTLMGLLQSAKWPFEIYSYNDGYEAIVWQEGEEYVADDPDFRAALIAATAEALAALKGGE